MTEREILEVLGQIEASPDADVSEYLSYHGEGHFHAWRVTLRDRPNTWIVKSPTHEDENRLVFRDLAIARIGRLFDPPITPEPALASVSLLVASQLACRAEDQGEPRCERAVAGSAVFATHRLGHAYKGTLQNLDRESIARVVAFGSWVDATDAEYVDGPEWRAYSIDHADSLHNATDWCEGEQVDVRFGDLARLDDGSLRDPALYRHFIEELRTLAPVDVIHTFAGIPLEWGGALEQRAHEAAYLLMRQPGMEGAVASFTS